MKGWKHHCQSSPSSFSASRGGLFRGVSFLFSFHHPQVKHLCLEHRCLHGHTSSLMSPPVHSSLEQGLLCIFLLRMFYDSTTFEEMIPVALPKGKEIVSSGRALPWSHVAVLGLGSRVQVAACHCWWFCLLFHFWCCFLRVCVWGKSKAIFSNG